MTALLGGYEIQLVGDAETRKERKSHRHFKWYFEQPESPLFAIDRRSALLGMTALLADMKYNWLEMRKHQKSEKVTGILNGNLDRSGVR
jgi:hypothetical protein